MYKYKITHTRVHHEDMVKSLDSQEVRKTKPSRNSWALTQFSPGCNVKTKHVKKNMTFKKPGARKILKFYHFYLSTLSWTFTKKFDTAKSIKCHELRVHVNIKEIWRLIMLIDNSVVFCKMQHRYNVGTSIVKVLPRCKHGLVQVQLDLCQGHSVITLPRDYQSRAQCKCSCWFI